VQVALLVMLIAHLLSQDLLAKAEETVPTIARAVVEDGTEEAKELLVEAAAGLPIRTLLLHLRSRILRALEVEMAKFQLLI
jgi:hypothetical protein